MKKIRSFLTLGLTLSALGCSDFLTESPTGTLTANTDVQSREIAEAFANGVYSAINTWNNGGGGWGGNNASLIEFLTGKADGNSQTEAFKFYNLEYDSRAFYIDNWWSGLYSGVNAANLAIDKLGANVALTDEERTNLLAQVKTLRALYYFQLVRLFGDVPKITTLITDLEQVETPRSPVKEIYDEIIIPDLLEAEESTLPWRDPSGRISMGAVKAILADVYLTYAGFPVQGGAESYAESAARSKEIIDSEEYSLFEEYTDMIDPDNRNSGEFILQVQHEKDIRHNGMTPVTLPAFLGIAAYADEYGGLVPRREFVRSFEANDKRTEEKQFFYTFYKGFPGDYPAGDPRLKRLNLGGYYIYKYFDKVAIDDDTKASINFTIYRYADVLLMYAEASNRAKSGPNALARASLNEVRTRAELPAVKATSQSAFEAAVWAERYFELCYEDKMWFDMIRTRKVRNDITKKWDDFVGHKTVYNKVFSAKNLLLPIPQRETNNNSALVQNPGFE